MTGDKAHWLELRLTDNCAAAQTLGAFSLPICTGAITTTAAQITVDCASTSFTGAVGRLGIWLLSSTAAYGAGLDIESGAEVRTSGGP